MYKEDQELNEFMVKLAHKIKEIQDDYNNLSNNNKIKANEWAKNIVQTQGIIGLINYFNRLN